MRIIAGALKGRRLASPTWEGLRPTSDKLRETLFNILAPRIEGARVLDGYAGTGAVGIEALSRGAAHVTFIEHNRRAVALIEQNLRTCGVEADYTIETGDLVKVLRRLVPPQPSREGGPPSAQVFDLIWLDPPYDITNVGEALETAAQALDPAGLIVLERATRRDPDVPSSLSRVRDVKSGDSTLTFLTTAV
jgi:16S rRNA (guanine(966)-N(2))-methyltransferase RsmD